MSLLDSLFNKHFGPVFVKEDSDADESIAKMKTLSAKALGKLKEKIDQQVADAEAGLYGERQVAYELKNSGMDMLVAHDLSIEKNGLSAQIDYLVLTPRHIFVIECKNLYGNVEIDDKGNFIRHIGNGKFYRKEGFTSPVSQNARHLNVLKEIRKDYKKNFVTQGMFDKLFPKFYRSIVVLANPKTVLNDKNAPKDVRDVVIRLDQLVAHIKTIEEQDKDLYSSSKDELQELLDSFLKCCKAGKTDYAKKYEDLLAEQKSNEPAGDEKYMPLELRSAQGVVANGPSASQTAEKICPRCGKPLVLRTAKRGDNAGNQFYGCSGFPKCRYIEQIKSA